MRQRLMILLAIFAAGFVMAGAAKSGAPADASGPYSLLYAAAPSEAMFWLVVFSAVAVCIGAVAGAFGNPLGGVFVVAMALIYPATRGGGIDLWLRAVESERDYWRLIMEMHLWAAWAVLVIFGAMALGQALARWFPGVFVQVADPEEIEELPDEVTTEESRIPVGLQPVLGALLAAVVGLVLTPFWVRSPDPQQVAWGLGAAYLLAGLFGHQTFPGGHPIGVLLAPFLGGAFWYVMVATDAGGAVAQAEGGLLEVYFSKDLIRGSLAMPVHYASAGLAGVTMGVGWSQVLLWSKAMADAGMERETSVDDT
jgi:hypothetical protein